MDNIVSPPNRARSDTLMNRRIDNDRKKTQDLMNQQARLVKNIQRTYKELIIRESKLQRIIKDFGDEIVFLSTKSQELFKQSNSIVDNARQIMQNSSGNQRILKLSSELTSEASYLDRESVEINKYVEGLQKNNNSLNAELKSLQKNNQSLFNKLTEYFFKYDTIRTIRNIINGPDYTNKKIIWPFFFMNSYQEKTITSVLQHLNIQFQLFPKELFFARKINDTDWPHYTHVLIILNE